MIKELTSLRFLFVAIIFLHHAQLLPRGSALAVACFFVLSGFSLTLGYGGKVLEPGFSFRRYAFRRLGKFFPLHWLCLLATLPLVPLTFDGGFWGELALNAFLCQSWVPDIDVNFSFNSVSWYLSDTICFALAFPLLFRLLVRLGPKQWVALTLCLVAVYVSLWRFLPERLQHTILYINPLVRVMDFVLSIGMAKLYLSGRVRDAVAWLAGRQWWQRWAAYALLGVACLSPLAIAAFAGVHLSLFTIAYWPLIAVLITAVAYMGRQAERPVAFKLFAHPLMVGLGGLSFEIYMTHQIVLRYVWAALDQAGMSLHKVAVAAVALAATLAVSWLLHRFFTVPLARKLQSYA